MSECRCKPAQVFHPGETIRDEMKARKWTITRMHRESGIPYSELGALMLGQQAVCPCTAAKLETAFGASAEFWLNLQRSYDEGQS